MAFDKSKHEDSTLESKQGQDSVAVGHAIAQRIIDQTKSHARDLRRVVHDLFNVDDVARVAAHKALTQFRNHCRDAAMETDKGERIEGMGSKDWKALAASATVRCSQLQTIIKAMRLGFGHETLKDQGIEDPENVGFDMMYKLAQKMVAAQAAASRDSEKKGRGRAMKAWKEKLSGWLESHVPVKDEPDYEEAQKLYAKLQALVA